MIYNPILKEEIDWWCYYSKTPVKSDGVSLLELPVRPCFCRILQLQMDVKLMRGTSLPKFKMILHLDSAYKFGWEKPCENDWNEWRQFWVEFTDPGMVLRVSFLGPWRHASHGPNEWYYNADADTIFKRHAGGGNYYSRIPSLLNYLRPQQKFRMSGPAPSIPSLEGFIPCVVTQLDDGDFVLGAMGQERYEPPPIEHDLFSLLRSWGGEWMWEEARSRLKALWTQ